MGTQSVYLSHEGAGFVKAGALVLLAIPTAWGCLLATSTLSRSRDNSFRSAIADMFRNEFYAR